MSTVPFAPDPPFDSIDAPTLAQRLTTADPLQLIDVREPWEAEKAAIVGATLLPLSQFEQWGPTLHAQLDPQVETIVLCHHGIRSAQMCQWLTQQGFSRVKNLQGGIEAYSLLVDPSVPRY